MTPDRVATSSLLRERKNATTEVGQENLSFNTVFIKASRFLKLEEKWNSKEKIGPHNKLLKDTNPRGREQKSRATVRGSGVHSLEPIADL